MLRLTGGAAGQQREEAVLDPLLGFWAALRVEGICRPPQVFEHVDDIELERDVDAGCARATLHALDLIRLAIDEYYPAALPFGVATQPLGERIVDDLLRTVLEARPHALVDGRGRLASRSLGSCSPCSTSAIVRCHSGSE